MWHRGLAEVPEWPHYLVLTAFRCTAFCSFGYSSTERRQLGHLQLRNFGPVFRSTVLLAFWKCSGAGRLALKLPALSDNSGAEAVCNKLYTSKVPLNMFVRKLCMWNALSGISLDCSHISGEKNDDADVLSRWNGDATTLPSRFRSEDRFLVDLPAFWNITFSVSPFPSNAKLLCGSFQLPTHLARLLRSLPESLSSTSTRFPFWALPRCCEFRLASFQPGLFVTAAALASWRLLFGRRPASRRQQSLSGKPKHKECSASAVHRSSSCCLHAFMLPVCCNCSCSHSVALVLVAWCRTYHERSLCLLRRVLVKSCPVARRTAARAGHHSNNTALLS